MAPSQAQSSKHLQGSKSGKVGLQPSPRLGQEIAVHESTFPKCLPAWFFWQMSLYICWTFWCAMWIWEPASACQVRACTTYIICVLMHTCVCIYIYIYIMVESNQTSFMHLSESEVSDKLRLWLLTQRLLGVFCGHTLRVFGHVQRQVQNNCWVFSTANISF